MKKNMMIAIVCVCAGLVSPVLASESAFDFDKGGTEPAAFWSATEVNAPVPQPVAADKLFAKKAICRDAFVTMMNQPAEQAVPEMKRMFEGINTADQKVCRMEITYKENQEKRGSIDVYVLDSRLDPFNHQVPATNEDASCSAGNTSVSARYSWRQDSGWHYKYSTELSIKKLEDGRLEVTYRQNKGEKLTCVGMIR